MVAWIMLLAATRKEDIAPEEIQKHVQAMVAVKMYYRDAWSLFLKPNQ
jgi:hypothetical protein